MTTTWTARAHDLVATLPPTLSGLWTAVRATESASAFLAHAAADRTATRAVGAALLCASAARCLDAARQGSGDETPDPNPHPVPELDGLPPIAADQPDPLRSLDDLLRDCLDLAVAVLDNEDEPLSLDQVHEIGAAVGLLDRARAVCSEVVE